ncbi:MAG: 2-isopropylmalate synthase [Methanomassiliicoccales archaeon]|nr:2-isopropylmalate synthase [Methanomassiliicoccales archaeon]
MTSHQAAEGASYQMKRTSGLDRKKVYTSHFNVFATTDSIPPYVEIFDTTLRDGEQTPGVALSLEEKIRIAEALNDLGVDVIEAGFPVISEGEREAVKRIASMGLQSRICALSRTTFKDIDTVIDCGVDYVHTFIATSDVHLKYKLKMTREEVKARAVSAIEYAKAHGLTVEFSCEDATRTDLDFLREMHLAVQDAGVDKINLPDTVGVISPPAMERLVEEVMKFTRVPLSVHCHDDFGLSVANSIAAVRRGAKQVHVCVNGLGERAGNAALEEVVLGLMAFLNVRTNVDTRKIGYVSKTVSNLTGIPIPANKAIVGSNAFAHESGIHVHGVLGDPSTYEAFGPELVGMERSIVIGKHTGVHSVKEKLREYGVILSDDQVAQVVSEIKRLAESEKHVDDSELVALAYHIAGQRPDEERKVTLKEFAVFTGLNITPTAVVSIDVNGETRRGSEIGVGPIDAALKAIRQLVSEKISLLEYRLSAISGGSDALCEVGVKLQYNGERKLMSVGRSVGPDIVQTSVDAAIQAIDRLYTRIHKEGEARDEGSRRTGKDNL